MIRNISSISKDEAGNIVMVISYTSIANLKESFEPDFEHMKKVFGKLIIDTIIRYDMMSVSLIINNNKQDEAQSSNNTFEETEQK